MDIPPKRNNRQHQPLTVILRNIIREYPAGGGVLRELCQNADDAGASEVEFVLDRKQYPTDKLIHSDLAEYQGISLLAFNNKTFSEVDFGSLSRIGDSSKAEDLNSTGKFGRGFNSVYNFTDNPSILSGTSLLLLDPHETWSASPGIGAPGGPLFDFVEHSQKPAMKNQLAAFSGIAKNLDAEFHGTIIRLPLRTEAQAKRSKIVGDDMCTKENDIIEIFDKFAGELVDSILFLRNIRSITLKVDDEIFAKVVATIGGVQGEFCVNQGYREVFVEQSKELCEADFMTEVSFYRRSENPGMAATESKIKFAVSHHLRKACEDDGLQKWARSQKLFPWIAIASPLERTTEFIGRLFTTLPLPIRAKHPVHIHGMLSITPDRSNIHTGGDWAVSANSETKLGAEWNKWLFHECLPHVWVRNLEFLRREGQTPDWSFWPAGSQEGYKELWMGICGAVFEKVVKENRMLLPTVCGTVETREASLFTFDMSDSLKSALGSAGALVVFPPAEMKYEISQLDYGSMGIKALTPRAARSCLTTLKDSRPLQELGRDHRENLLDYVLSDGDFGDLHTCEAPLIPVADGTFQGFDIPVSNDGLLLFAQDELEEQLFRGYQKAVDTSKLSQVVLSQFRDNLPEIQRHTRIRAWTVEDAARFCELHIFPAVTDPSAVSLYKDGFAGFIDLFWGWISVVQARSTARVNISAVNDFWLLPIGDERYQKLASVLNYPVLDVSANKGIGSFLGGTATLLSRRHAPEVMYLHSGDGFSENTTRCLQEFGLVKEYDDVYSLAKWLEVTMGVFTDRLNDNEKKDLIRHLYILSEEYGVSGRDHMKSVVPKLTVFREAKHPQTGESNPWISVDRGSRTLYVGVKDLSIILDTPDHLFIDMNHESTELLNRRLGLIDCPSLPNILKNHIVPRISDMGTSDDERRTELIEFALDNFDQLPPESRIELSRKQIVPVNINTTLLKVPGETVAGTLVNQLFFPEEERCATEDFSARYLDKLVELGMSAAVTTQILLERIEAYSRFTRPYNEIQLKVRSLFTHDNPPQPLPGGYRGIRWIPARSPAGDRGLFSATECQSQDHKELLSYAMPIMEFSISPSWLDSLGWSGPLPPGQLLDQLEAVTERNDVAAWEALAKYWCREGNYQPGPPLELETREWLLSASGSYHRPEEIFLEDAGVLEPYFGKIRPPYNEERYQPFFTGIGVERSPTFEQLCELNDRIAQKGDLSSEDLKVAVAVIKLVSKKHLDSSERFPGLKAPDQNLGMRALSEFTASADGPEESVEQIVSLHESISSQVTKRLGLPTPKDRILQALNDPSFDSEFSQAESPKAVIKDTLERYPLESTFSEYLANAEDCGTAREIRWLLDSSDDGNSSKKGLIDRKISTIQGPALFCYNDGEFTSKDFKGIIDIGIGSKRDDPTRIGKFGRGALTMYFWTSAPSFISGSDYVIFDPENKYLPPHPLTGKPRGGLKLKIRDVRKRFPAQLKPFEGVFGFEVGSDSFKGTIFRFPFRTTQKSFLTSKILGSQDAYACLENYYWQASASLLFLQNISSISFWKKGTGGLKMHWNVSSTRTKTSFPRIEEVTIKGQNHGAEASPERWWIITGSTDEEQLPNNLIKMARHNRLEAKYSLAASTSCAEGSLFMGLPIQSSTMLPVSINANMALQSDRRTVIAGRSGDSEGFEWNNFIFERGVAPLYLRLLDFLMGTLGSDGYCFWPTPPSGNPPLESIGEIISEAFWKRVADSRYSLYPPVPLERPQKPMDDIMENLGLEAAVFDLLEPTKSEVIVPLLLRLGINNIASPEGGARSGLKEYKSERVKTIDPAFLRKALQSKCEKFLKVLVEDNISVDYINNLNRFLIKDASPNSLVGLPLLPLADGSWGKISAKSSNLGYFVPNSLGLQESGILEVSKENQIRGGLDQNILNFLLENNLNVSRFGFEAIPQLFNKLCSRDSNYRKEWLRRVWSYFRLNVETKPQYDYLPSLDNLPAYCGNTTDNPDEIEFLTPSAFSSWEIPAILDPLVPKGGESDKLLRSLKGLILVNRSTFPPSALEQEGLDKATGLHRLLKAIESLASSASPPKSLTQYIIGTVTTEGIATLKKIFRPHIKQLLLAYPSAKQSLGRLPLWRVGESLQPATEVKLAPDPSLTSTGVTDSATFLKPRAAEEFSEVLEQLGVRKLSFDTFLYNEVGLGSGYISPQKIPHYKSFVEALFRINPDLFAEYPLGIDGDGRFRKLCDLYDSSLVIFMAAFRDLAKTKFLHPDVAGSWVWERTPLMTRVTGDRYIECALSIERRNGLVPPDDQLYSDSQKVFNFLCWDKPDMQFWTSSTWDSLIKIRFAPIQDSAPNGRPKLQFEKTEEFLRGGKLTRIADAVIPRQANIAWSQKPVLRESPGSYALGKLDSTRATTKVTPDTVLGHLQFISSHRDKVPQQELQKYITDIKKCYEYLERRINTRFAINPDSVVWLNVRAEDIRGLSEKTFRESWTCLKNLCLGMQYDTPPIRDVRSFLIPFHGLLEHAKVEKKIGVRPPPVPADSKSPDDKPLLNKGLISLRERRLLFDVEIAVGDTGKVFEAHRVVLASTSPYWERMFASSFAESNEKRITLQEIRPETVSMLLDYIYTGDFVTLATTGDTTTDLEILLGQLQGSDIWCLPELKKRLQYHLAADVWVRPETVREMLEASKLYNADILGGVCRRYIEDNAKIIARLVEDEATVTVTDEAAPAATTADHP